MVFAIRHGVLGYEAMGLNRLLEFLPFGVFIYEATRAEGIPQEMIRSLTLLRPK